MPRADGTLKKAPYVPVFLQGDKGKLIKVTALLDSGADTTIIPKDLATVLGLKLHKYEEETGGIGGKVKVRKAQVSLIIKGGHEKYSLNIPVLVLEKEDIDVPLLLGRNGFFENFHITFRQNEEKITLKKVHTKKVFYGK